MYNMLIFFFFFCISYAFLIDLHKCINLRSIISSFRRRKKSTWMYKLIGKINLHNSMVNNNLVNFNIFFSRNIEMLIRLNI